MTIREIIIEYRKKHGISQRKFAENCGVSNGYISMIEKGINPKTKLPITLSIQMYKALATGMNISLNDLLLLADDSPIALDNDTTPEQSVNLFVQDNIFPIERKRFPLLGNTACGELIFADEERKLYVEAGTDIKADFCLQAKDDSMTGARIHDGDIVFIRSQPTVENNEIAAVIIDDKVTLKRVHYDRENNILLLFPENPRYETIRCFGEKLDHIRIIGKAVAFQGDIV